MKSLKVQGFMFLIKVLTAILIEKFLAFCFNLKNYLLTKVIKKN